MSQIARCLGSKSQFLIPNSEMFSKVLRVSKPHSLRVFFRDDGIPTERPGDIQIRIVPNDGALRLRVPIVSNLVQEFRRSTRHQEAVRKAGRNPEYLFVLG